MMASRTASAPCPASAGPFFTGLRQEVITLDEGDVTITFPADLSPDSFDDLKDHLDLFVKKMQRRASVQKIVKERFGHLSEDDEAAN
jgi:hypothetical protein